MANRFDDGQGRWCWWHLAADSYHNVVISIKHSCYDEKTSLSSLIVWFIVIDQCLVLMRNAKILNFIAWCYHFTQLNSSLTFRAITAAVSFLQDNGISINGKQRTFIRRLQVGHAHFTVSSLFIKHWISVRIAWHKTRFRPKNFLFIHENEKPFRCDQLNKCLGNGMDGIVRRKKVKLDPPNYAAHTLRIGGYTNKARHVVSSWGFEMTRRWSSKKWKQTCINADGRDMAKLGVSSVSTLLGPHGITTSW